METLIFNELPNGNLQIKATKDGKELIKDGLNNEHKNYDDIWYDLLEETACNGSYCFVRPEDIAALTTSPIISNDITIEDDGQVKVNGKIWWYPQYQVNDELRLLAKGKTIEFQNAA